MTNAGSGAPDGTELALQILATWARRSAGRRRRYAGVTSKVGSPGTLALSHATPTGYAFVGSPSSPTSPERGSFLVEHPTPRLTLTGEGQPGRSIAQLLSALSDPAQPVASAIRR